MNDSAGRLRIVLINPNTDAATTDAMLSIACAAAPDAEIVGVTAPFGVPLIATPDELRVAEDAVRAVIETLAPASADGIIIAAFGDPGLAAARKRLPAPVVGIAEAGLRAASAIGRFSVVTTTPALAPAIRRLAEGYGCGHNLASVRLTDGDPANVMRDRERLVQALEAGCRLAIEADGAEAIVIGGGPLAVAARELAMRLPVPIVEPLPCAVIRLRDILTGKSELDRAGR